MDPEIENLKKQIEDLKDRLHSKEYEDKPLNIEEIDELVWEAPVRVFNPWNRKKITTVLMWVSIICIVTLFLREFLLLILIILLTMVSFALVIVPPTKTKHKITNKGLMTFNKLYLWNDLSTFWIGQKGTDIVMYVNTNLVYPTRLFFVIPQESLDRVVTTLSKHLKYYDRREKQNGVNKIADGKYYSYNELKSLYTSSLN